MMRCYYYFKTISGISQAKGLRDPECGGSFEPFVFIECRRDARGDQGVIKLELVPLSCAALGIIGQVGSRLPIKIE